MAELDFFDHMALHRPSGGRYRGRIMSSIRRTVYMAAVLTGVLSAAPVASAQTSSLAPMAPAPAAKHAVPERIEPIVAPLPPPKPAAVAPVARTPASKVAAKSGGARITACNPGERLQRKTGTCQALIDPGKTGPQAALPKTAAIPQKAATAKASTAAKPAPNATKVAKPKVPNKKG